MSRSRSSFGLTVEDIYKLNKLGMHNVHSLEDCTNMIKQLGGLEGIAEKLKTDLKNGLSNREAESGFSERKAFYGENRIPQPELTPIWKIVLESLQDTTLIILMVCAALSLVLGGIVEGWPGTIEGFAIFMAVGIVSTVTAFNDHQKEKQFRSLKQASEETKTIECMRGGEQVSIHLGDIQVGDVIVFDTGKKLPADGILIEGHDIKVDESAFTGESESVEKSSERPILFSGSEVNEGTGTYLVTAVGLNTDWGRILAKLGEEEPPETPLQTKLNEMAELIGKGGLGFAILTFLALLLFWIIAQVQHGFKLNHIVEILDFLIIAVTIVVVAVPEGLPLAVTISLAYSVKQMYADNNLVRHLSACETMGGATTICSDKTGTLTQNRMAVRKGWVANAMFDIDAHQDLKVEQNVRDLLNIGIATNTGKSKFSRSASGPPEFIGSKTDCALLVYISDNGCDYKRVRETYPLVSSVPFSSARKRMSSIIRTDKVFRMFTKGAAEIILGLSTYVLTPNGQMIPMTPKLKSEIENVINEYANMGLRAVSMAYRDFDLHEEEVVKKPPEDNLCFVGVMGIEDPLRPEVRESIRQCQRAGIVVRMVTGDNLATAKKIARDCGILTDGIAMEGPDFDELTYDEIDDILPRLQVLARSSPTDKYNLVKRLMHNGDVVAVTGDGTNDAQALKKADVGLAMGIQGTDVAQEASAIVILDDNFTSIQKSVMWGRCVFDNIRKFLQFQLTVNVVALVVAFVGALSGKGTPLSAVQLLWVNLIMDTMAALALGTEKPTPDLLDRKPHGRTASLISPIMWRNIFGQALFQIGMLFTILYVGQFMFDVDQEGSISHYTLVFNLFVFMQVWNEFNSRKVNNEFNVFHNIHTNYIFLGIIVITVIVQIIIVQTPGVNTLVRCTGLNLSQWLACLLISFLSLPIGILVRLIPVPKQEEPDQSVPHIETTGSGYSTLIEEDI